MSARPFLLTLVYPNNSFSSTFFFDFYQFKVNFLFFDVYFTKQNRYTCLSCTNSFQQSNQHKQLFSTLLHKTALPCEIYDFRILSTRKCKFTKFRTVKPFFGKENLARTSGYSGRKNGEKISINRKRYIPIYAPKGILDGLSTAYHSPSKSR